VRADPYLAGSASRSDFRSQRLNTHSRTRRAGVTDIAPVAAPIAVTSSGSRGRPPKTNRPVAAPTSVPMIAPIARRLPATPTSFTKSLFAFEPPGSSRGWHPCRMSTGAEAKNLEAISKAIDHHNATCPFPAVAVEMNPFEIERLGWDEIRGLPVRPNAELGTGAFRVVCAREEGEPGEVVEAVADQTVPVTIGG
jgi:hypothetical protein